MRPVISSGAECTRTFLIVIAVAVCTAAQGTNVSVPCSSGFMGFESGTIVARMPPDGVVTPTGALATPGAGNNGLVLGDTVGATSGAHGFIVSCSLRGYLGPNDVVSSAVIVLTHGVISGVDPLSSAWVSRAGKGPAQLHVDMVNAWGAARWALVAVGGTC